MKRTALTLGLIYCFLFQLLAQTPGTTDETFKSHNTSNGPILRISILPDDKIMVFGDFTMYDGEPRYKLARLHKDGRLDQGFIPPTSIRISTHYPLPNGNVLIGGGFKEIDGVPRNGLALLNSDGSLNLDFVPATSPISYVAAIVVQSDGKIIIAGSFNGTHAVGDQDYLPINEYQNWTLERLIPDGSLDKTFITNRGTYSSEEPSGILDIVLDDEERVILVGLFSHYNTNEQITSFISRYGIARANQDGSVDLTFDPKGSGFNHTLVGEPLAYRVKIGTEGQIFVSGEFDRYNGQVRHGFAKILEDGSLDNFFAGINDPNSLHPAFAIQTDGKVIISQNYYSYSPLTPKGLIRLEENGVLDNTFHFDDYVISPTIGYPFSDISLQSDGKIIVVGNFNDKNGERKYITRLHNYLYASPCRISLCLKPNVVIHLGDDGIVDLLPEMFDDGSTSTCGSLRFVPSKSIFSCADIGTHFISVSAFDDQGNEETAEISVTVSDNTSPVIGNDLVNQTFLWLMFSGDKFILPDFRASINADDNCSFEITQIPSPGTEFLKPHNGTIEFLVRDSSGNTTSSNLAFALLVLDCLPAGTGGKIDMESEFYHFSVPWNTEFDKLVTRIPFQNGSDKSFISQIVWEQCDYNNFIPGNYTINANFNNSFLKDSDLSLNLPVIVRKKPMAKGITISNDLLRRNLLPGEIIGTFETIDPSDNVHYYIINDSNYFYLHENALVWKGVQLSEPGISFKVSSIDRAGQTISEDINLKREWIEQKDILLYPNPVINEINIEVGMLSAQVTTIIITDAQGKTIFLENIEKSGQISRRYNLEGRSPGIYLVIIQTTHVIIAKKFIKK